VDKVVDNPVDDRSVPVETRGIGLWTERADGCRRAADQPQWIPPGVEEKKVDDVRAA
jgi:hypothetical protein